MNVEPEWWNGRHDELKIRWAYARVGSSPTSGINEDGSVTEWFMVTVLKTVEG